MESPLLSVEASPRVRCFKAADPAEVGRRIELVNDNPVMIYGHARRPGLARARPEARPWSAKSDQEAAVPRQDGETSGGAAGREHGGFACPQAGEFIIGAKPAPTLLTDRDGWASVAEPLQAMMHLDFATYLADDILVKVDRASMGVSLEIRCPFLDHRIVELAWPLPLSIRVGLHSGKRILRKVLERYMPRQLTERSQAGFGVPVSEWTRGALRDWAEDLLAERRLRTEGFLKPAAVRRVWRQHLCSWRDHENLLWALLVFQAWHDAWAGDKQKPVPLHAAS